MRGIDKSLKNVEPRKYALKAELFRHSKPLQVQQILFIFESHHYLLVFSEACTKNDKSETSSM